MITLALPQVEIVNNFLLCLTEELEGWTLKVMKINVTNVRLESNPTNAAGKTLVTFNDPIQLHLTADTIFPVQSYKLTDIKQYEAYREAYEYWEE